MMNAHELELQAQRTIISWTERAAKAEAEVERLKAALLAIERRTAPSTRTFDDSIRDMGLANDLARAALEEGKT